MKTFIKVSGSDRHSDGDVLMTIQSFGEVIYSGRGREIEITEEEIEKELNDTFPYGIKEHAYSDVASLILSKLKRE
jgi:ribosomal protein L20A (L18A)